MLKLAPDWKVVLKKAWSIRFMVLTAFFTSAEFLLPYFADAFPRGLFAGLSVITITASLFSRVMWQKDLNNGNH